MSPRGLEAEVGFNDWIRIDPAQMTALDRFDEVDAIARENLAKELQTRLRTTIDPGISLRAAQRAQAVRVASEGNRLVIDSEDQAEVLGASSETVEEPSDPNIVTNVDQLFELSSGVPSIVDGKLVYRMISPSALLGKQQQENERDRIIEQTTTETLRINIADAFDDATRDVRNRNPGDR